MRLEGPGGAAHLTYCTNIHAGEAWPDVLLSLRRHVPKIKAQVAPDQPFGLGLRLGAAASHELESPEAMEELGGFLEETGAYVFTINGFPYGPFHAQAVKEKVYAPDWAGPERLAYTNRLASQLARLLPEGSSGTISTVPGTYRPWADGRREAIVRHLLDHAAHLVRIEAETGRRIALALEPEPCCLLETIAEAVAFFEHHLFSKAGIEGLAGRSGLDHSQAEAALRSHLGLCYDVCHAAVEFEDPTDSIAALRRAGITVFKLQISSALRLAPVSRDKLDRLTAFDEPVYLHQVVSRSRGRLKRYRDIPDAMARFEQDSAEEWRVHFHVPIFLEELEHFATTQSFLKDILRLHRREAISEHLEVETYTWDVLPEGCRLMDLSEAVARELQWARSQLGA